VIVVFFSKRRPAARLLVNGSFAAPGFKTKVVNGRAPELFPVMSLVKKWFARREI
jgi:hypothetical protein